MADTKQDDAGASLDAAAQSTVMLDTPIQRGKTVLKEIAIRRPQAGAFRGVALVDVMRMEAQALQKVLPRITEPALTEDELRRMNPADMFQLGEVVSGFLLPKKYQEEQG